MSRLDGKLAIVTGAASGIGRQIALRFAREGAKVAVADLDPGRAQEVVYEISTGGGIATAVAMDVADEAQVKVGVDDVAARLGGIDILVSNAGIQHIAPLVDLSLGDWRKILAVHLDGAFLTTRACLRHMIRQGRGGSVVYIGSVHSVEASPLKAPYVAAKHGLIGLARLVAKEGAAHGVRANVICPGFVRTPLVDRQIPEQARELGLTEDQVVKTVMLRETVDGEFTAAEDIAEVAVFFAAFPSLALTGQSLIVSHGWHMQ
ncbi:MAG: 3-hydroxybutyrate dehydrogenase [Isosphaeraceae bacterium]